MTKGVFGVMCLTLLLAACRARKKSAVERGAGVYARACATCHGSSGMPGRKQGFSVLPPDLAEPALQRRLGDDDIRRTVRDGKGEMPPFGRMLSEEELSQLVAYLRSLPESAPTQR